MDGNEPIIEAEVVEIDGVAVEPRPQPRGGFSGEDWRGRVKRLDPRWMPLWLVLGFAALVVAVAAGMCALVVLVIWRTLKAILRGIANLFRG